MVEGLIVYNGGSMVEKHTIQSSRVGCKPAFRPLHQHLVSLVHYTDISCDLDKYLTVEK